MDSTKNIHQHKKNSRKQWDVETDMSVRHLQYEDQQEYGATKARSDS